jgi:hypothetical protein
MLINYNLYNSIFDLDDLAHVVNPFGVNEGFPAKPQMFNIIRPRIDLLLGEETKRPNNIRVVDSNPGAVGALQAKRKELLQQYVFAEILASMDPEQAKLFQQQLASGEIVPPEQIEQFISTNYKLVGEECAYHTLKYLQHKLDLSDQFSSGFKDGLIAGEEIYYVGVRNSEPYAERVNPTELSYDNSPGVRYIEDGEWAVRRMHMTVSDIYDSFYDKLESSDLDKLLELLGQHVGGSKYTAADRAQRDYGIQYFPNGGPLFSSNGTDATGVLPVWHVCWRSYKKVGFLTYDDPETGELVETMVDESYKPTGEEISLEWDWVVEIWEGYRVSDDIYFGIKPIENQHISMDNPNAKKLPYIGVRYSDDNSESRSLIDLMKPLQYMSTVIWYRIELALARDKGKVPVMDVTQIPKSMGITTEKWMHYLSALGVLFVNPYEAEDSVPGRDASHPSAFNQYSALDLTMANTISGYIELLERIDNMAGEIAGVTDQRLGAISQNELVGNVERAVLQSANRTEMLFWRHEQCKKHVLTALLDTSKAAWAKSGRKSLHYLLSDGERIFLEMDDEFLYSDHDIFITDASKEVANIEALKTLYQPAMQNGANLADIAEIMAADNMAVIRRKLNDIKQEMAERVQAQQQAEQQAQQQLVELENEREREKLEVERYKVDRDCDTRLAVAELQAEVKAQDRNANGIPDSVELSKLDLEREKLLTSSQDARLTAQSRLEEARAKADIARMQVAAKRLETEAKIKQTDLAVRQAAIQAKVAEVQSDSDIVKANAAVEESQLMVNIKAQELAAKRMDTMIKAEELKQKTGENSVKMSESEAKLMAALQKIEADKAKVQVERKKASDDALLRARELDITEEKNSADVQLELQRLALEEELGKEKIKADKAKAKASAAKAKSSSAKK